MNLERSSAGIRPAELLPVRPQTPLFEQVFALGESQKRLVGMLPGEAWLDYANRGHLLAAVEAAGDDVDPERLLGYVAYRLPRDRVALAHLVVKSEHRGRGIARLLVDTLSRQHADRRGIQAKCRRDYEASKVWPALGFIAQGDLAGRGSSPSNLTVWWRDHGHPDLMTWAGAPASITPVVIDANVFIDLHTSGEGSNAHTREILTETLFGRIELLVSPELGNEINRHETDVERARLQSVRQTYPAINVDPLKLETNRGALITELGSTPANKRDASDLAHVCYAASAGVPVVVTRDDRAAKKLRSAARELFNVAVVCPQELVALLDEVETADAYTPSALLGTGYSLREASTADHSLLGSFLDMGSGERRNDFNSRMRKLAEHRDVGATRLLVVSPTGDPVALLGADPSDGVLNVEFLRMVPFQLATTMAAQLVSQLRPLAVRAGVGTIRVTDPYPNALLAEALISDGFAASHSGTVALAINTACKLEDVAHVVHKAAAPLTDSERNSLAVIRLADAVSGSSTPTETAALERLARPLRILDGPIDTWIVPIKPIWSSQLFSEPADIYGQPPELGISVEHVYYRGGRSGETAPARVLWYVSGDMGHRIIGCSELVEVRDGSPKELHREFRRLGVYEWEQVRQVAEKSGMVRALRVTNTELFTRHISLPRLRELAAQERQALQLISPKRINAGLFARLLLEGRT